MGTTDDGPSWVTQEAHQAQSRLEGAKGGEGTPSGAVRRHGGRRRKPYVAVIDDVPLRQTSTLGYLRPLLRFGVVGFASGQELLAERERGAIGEPRGIILALGTRAPSDPAVAREVERLSRALGETALIVVSDRRDPLAVTAAFRLGVRGYVPTSMRPELCVHAVQLVLGGGLFFPVDAVTRRRWSAPDVGTISDPGGVIGTVADGWPPRQLAVLRLLVRGMANKDIARTLAMEEGTVKVHVHHIIRKLGVRNRTQAAVQARRMGMAEAGDDRSGPTATYDLEERSAAARSAATAYPLSRTRPSVPRMLQ